MIIRATSLGSGAPYPEKRRSFLPGRLTWLQVSQNVFSAAFLWEATQRGGFLQGIKKPDYLLESEGSSGNCLRFSLTAVGSSQPRLGPQGRRGDEEINVDKLVKR